MTFTRQSFSGRHTLSATNRSVRLQHVVPAKHEMVHGRKDPDTLRTKFEPQPKDVRTELIIAESKRLSARSPVIWTDSGRVQNGRDR